MKVVLYALAVGSLIYAMVCTRPYNGHAVGVVSTFLANPGKGHWIIVCFSMRQLECHTSQQESKISLEVKAY